MRTINVGVIGVGAMGYNHARVYSKLENANLVAVADVVKPTLDKVVKKYKTKGYSEIEDLLKDPEIEAVSVCVPTTFHHEVVMEAIKHGKHVLVEKPIAFTAEEAEEMIKAMRRGHQGSIGTIHSSSPEMAIADIMDMINEDGKPRSAEMLLKKVTNAIDIVIQIRRFEDGKRRIVNISEVHAKPETDLNFSYEIRHLWEWVVDYSMPDKGYFRRTARASKTLKAKLHYYGLSIEEAESL